jgi:hypothetical protein
MYAEVKPNVELETDPDGSHHYPGGGMDEHNRVHTHGEVRAI